jgi:hypothetical protein
LTRTGSSPLTCPAGWAFEAGPEKAVRAPVTKPLARKDA